MDLGDSLMFTNFHRERSTGVAPADQEISCYSVAEAQFAQCRRVQKTSFISQKRHSRR
jgi:hypothetical protein